jgi:hypothetical protein
MSIDINFYSGHKITETGFLNIISTKFDKQFDLTFKIQLKIRVLKARLAKKKNVMTWLDCHVVQFSHQYFCHKIDGFDELMVFLK